MEFPIELYQSVELQVTNSPKNVISVTIEIPEQIFNSYFRGSNELMKRFIKELAVKYKLQPLVTGRMGYGDRTLICTKI